MSGSATTGAQSKPTRVALRHAEACTLDVLRHDRSDLRHPRGNRFSDRAIVSEQLAATIGGTSLAYYVNVPNWRFRTVASQASSASDAPCHEARRSRDTPHGGPLKGPVDELPTLGQVPSGATSTGSDVGWSTGRSSTVTANVVAEPSGTSSSATTGASVSRTTPAATALPSAPMSHSS